MDTTDLRRSRPHARRSPSFSAELHHYDAPIYCVGRSMILTMTDDRSTREDHFVAHHVTVKGGKRQLMLASLRYVDIRS